MAAFVVEANCFWSQTTFKTTECSIAVMWMCL
jgi:hypothetical protein